MKTLLSFHLIFFSTHIIIYLSSSKTFCENEKNSASNCFCLLSNNSYFTFSLIICFILSIFGFTDIDYDDLFTMKYTELLRYHAFISIVESEVRWLVLMRNRRKNWYLRMCWCLTMLVFLLLAPFFFYFLSGIVLFVCLLCCVFFFLASFLVYLLYFNAPGYACSTYFISQLLFVAVVLFCLFSFIESFSSHFSPFLTLCLLHFILSNNTVIAASAIVVILLVVIELKTTILLKDSG